MARNTKMKIAAIATALVATLGVAGASTAVSSDAGKAPIHHSSLRGDTGSWCC